MTLTGTYLIDFRSDKFVQAVTPRMKLMKDRLPTVFFTVTFPQVFPSPPAVVLGLSGFMGGSDAFEFTTEPIKITETGFEIRLTGRLSWIEILHISWLATDA